MEDFGGLPDLFGGQNQFSQNPFEQSFGGISAIPLDLQTELRRLSLQQNPAQAQQSPGAGFNPMSLLGLGGGASGLLGATNTNPGDNLGGLAGLAVPGIGALFYSLFRNENSPGQRLVSNIGDHIIQPLANFGGRASVQSQLDRMNNLGPLGRGSGFTLHKTG